MGGHESPYFLFLHTQSISSAYILNLNFLVSIPTLNNLYLLCHSSLKIIEIEKMFSLMPTNDFHFFKFRFFHLKMK